MLRIIEDSPGEVEGLPTDLDELARESARRMLVAELEAEVTAYVERHRAEQSPAGSRRSTTSGYTSAAARDLALKTSPD
jgi:hypothetical protein